MAEATILATTWTAITAVGSNYANTEFLKIYSNPFAHNLTRFIGCVLISLFLGLILRIKGFKFTISDLKEKIPIFLVPAFSMACMNVSNSYALVNCGVTLTYVVKSTIPLWTVLWSLSQGVRYEWTIAPALLISCIGVALASFADFEFNILGFGFAMLSTITTTVFNVSSKICVEKARSTPTEGFVVCAFICYAVLQVSYIIQYLLFPETMPVYGPIMVELQAQSYAGLILLILTGATYLSEYVLNFQYCAIVTPLTFAITDIIRRVTTIVVNSVMYDKELVPLNLTGIGLAIGGALLYSIIVNKPAAMEKTDESTGARQKKVFKGRSTSPAPGKKKGNNASKNDDDDDDGYSEKKSLKEKTQKKAAAGAGERQDDILDKLVNFMGEKGLLALAVLGAAIYVAQFGIPLNKGMVLCALFMGMGKGGVPGFSTLASAFFALMAPEGMVNQMMAIVVPITMLSDVMVGMAYFRDALWSVAFKIALWSGIGIILGMQINAYMSDDITRRSIGVVFLGIVMLQAYDKFKSSFKNSELSKEEQEVKKAAKKEFLFSIKVLAPVGILGGIASYITNNMGPMLNVYLLALDVDKYTVVGTRSAIFITINSVKLVSRIYKGDLPIEALPYGFSLGAVAVVGVILAKIWMKNASQAVFQFVYEKVTFSVVSVTGCLLVMGYDMKALATFFYDLSSGFFLTPTGQVVESYALHALGAIKETVASVSETASSVLTGGGVAVPEVQEVVKTTSTTTMSTTTATTTLVVAAASQSASASRTKETEKKKTNGGEPKKASTKTKT